MNQPIKFFSRGLLYQATLEGPSKLEKIERVYEDGKRRTVQCYDKQFSRIANTFWRIRHQAA
jgi:DNA polymerase IIIc chi subunit